MNFEQTCCLIHPGTKLEDGECNVCKVYEFPIVPIVPIAEITPTWACFNCSEYLNIITEENCANCRMNIIESQRLSETMKVDAGLIKGNLETIDRSKNMASFKPAILPVYGNVDTDTAFKKVKAKFWSRARAPMKGNYLEVQAGLQCAMQSINNVLGLKVLEAEESNEDDPRLFVNAFAKVNINVIHNYVERFGLDTLVEPDPERVVRKENYSVNVVSLALAVIGYSIDVGNAWRLNGDYFISDSRKYHKKDVAGWILHSGGSEGGHWTCVRYDGKNSYLSIDSLALRAGRTPTLSHSPPTGKAFLVYYDYIVSPWLVDNGYPGDTNWWEYTFKKHMENKGYCHHMDLYGKSQRKP
jgi:hypothetical protein